jgi:hypothetical protein
VPRWCAPVSFGWECESRRGGQDPATFEVARVYLFCTYSVDFGRFQSISSFKIIGSSCKSGVRNGSSPPFRTILWIQSVTSKFDGSDEALKRGL